MALAVRCDELARSHPVNGGDGASTGRCQAPSPARKAAEERGRPGGLFAASRAPASPAEGPRWSAAALFPPPAPRAAAARRLGEGCSGAALPQERASAPLKTSEPPRSPARALGGGGRRETPSRSCPPTAPTPSVPLGRPPPCQAWGCLVGVTHPTLALGTCHPVPCACQSPSARAKDPPPSQGAPTRGMDPLSEGAPGQLVPVQHPWGGERGLVELVA